jgi:hypothetical protein
LKTCLPADIEHQLIAREIMSVDDANETLALWKRSASAEGGSGMVAGVRRKFRRAARYQRDANMLDLLMTAYVDDQLKCFRRLSARAL